MDNEKEILDLIGKKFEEEAKRTQVPDARSVENTVAMLKAKAARPAAVKEPVSLRSAAAEAEKYRRQIAYLKRIIAVAASLLVIVVTALILNTRNNISITGKKNNSGADDITPEKIAEYIYGAVKKTDKKSSSQSTTKKPGVFKSSADDEEAVSEPTTLLAQQKVPEAVISGSGKINAKVNFIRCDGKYIYRYVTAASSEETKSYIDIVSLSSLERAGEKTIIPGGKCFDIIVSGNTLAALMKSDRSVKVEYYDITDRSSPVKSGEYTQSGEFSLAAEKGGKLFIITNCETNTPANSVNGNQAELTQEDSIKNENPLGGYTVITATDINNLNSEIVKGTVSGRYSDIIADGSGVYLAYESTDGESGAKSVEIDRLTLYGNNFKAAASASVKGAMAGSPAAVQGGIAVVTENNKSVDLTVLSAYLEPVASAENIYSGKVSGVYSNGGSVCISGSGGVVTAGVSDDGKITVYQPSGSGSRTASAGEVSGRGITVIQGKPDSEGNSEWTMINSSGETVSFTLDSRSISIDPARESVGTESGDKVGIPVKINKSRGYLFFSTDVKGRLTAYPKPYIFKAADNDICFVSGDSFYIVSNDSITSVSLSEII